MRLNTSFRIGTGEVDEMCFSKENELSGVILNRYGVIRLLNAIEKQYPNLNLCISSKKLMQDLYARRDERNENEQIHPTENDSRINKNYHQGRTTTVTNNSYGPPLSLPLQHSQNRMQRVTGPPVFNKPAHRNRRRNSQPIHKYRYSKEENSYNKRKVSPSQENETANYSMPHRLRDRHTMGINRQNGRQGCYNCGEYNHRQNSCRFDHRLKCGNCYELGHKRKMCLAFVIRNSAKKTRAILIS